MAGKRRILAVNALFLSLGALVATFQHCGFLLSLLMTQSLRQKQLTVQATQQYNAAVARLRHIRTRINRRRGRMWRNSGRTEQWWLNLFDGILPEREWKKNLRMDRAVFMSVVNELRPFLQPARSPRGLDVLSVEKQLAMTLYFLKDQSYDDSKCICSCKLQSPWWFEKYATLSLMF